MELGLVVILLATATAFAVVERLRAMRWRSERARMLRVAVDEPPRRAAVLAALGAELAELGRRRAALWGTRAIEAQRAEARLARAMLLNLDDRAEEALEELMQINPDRVSRMQQTMLAMYAIDAHLRLGEWDAAERVLDGYPLDALNDTGRALRANARAQIRIGRGDSRGALRVLDDAGAPPGEVRGELDLTRARALALDGRDAPLVWKLLSGLGPRALERLLARHGGEPAARAARRILDGAGPES